MIAFSDNTATNLVLDAIGIGATAATMEAMGYPNTKIHSKVFRRDTSVFPERSKKFGLGSTTAAEMIRLCEESAPPSARQPGGQRGDARAPASLRRPGQVPPVPAPRHEARLQDRQPRRHADRGGNHRVPGGPVALCVLSCDNEDKRWVPDNAGNVLCAEVAREVFQYYQKRAPTWSNPRIRTTHLIEPELRPGPPATAGGCPLAVWR